MFNLTQLSDVDQLVKLWPRLLSLAYADRPETTSKKLLPLLLACVSNGAVFLVRGDSGLVGFVCVDVLNEHNVALRSIPKERVPGMAKACLTAVKEWAKREGFRRILVTSYNFSGSNFKYFKHTLGLPQYSVTFSTKV